MPYARCRAAAGVMYECGAGAGEAEADVAADADAEVDVSVVDVYELAAAIGKECEVTIEKFGAEAVSALLPKVIGALELLEALALRRERGAQRARDLQARVHQLETDKVEKAEYRQRFEKEIEAVEEQWRAESAELVSGVARLQEENRRLRRALQAQEPPGGLGGTGGGGEGAQGEAAGEGTGRAAERAGRRHEQLLHEKQLQVDTLTAHVERLTAAARDLRAQHQLSQQQVRAGEAQREELEAVVRAQQRDLLALSALRATHSGGHDTDAGTGDGTSGHREEAAAEGARAASAAGAGVSAAGASACELPVQGPLPAEPPDAPWKRRAGIRQFFRMLFVESELYAGPGVGAVRRRPPAPPGTSPVRPARPPAPAGPA